MRLGLLQCDHVADTFQHIAGDYDDMFRELFASNAPEVDIVVFDVASGDIPATHDACDGYLTTGSRHSVYASLPWLDRLKEFVVHLHETRTPLVGVCFGHQLIAEALGGRVQKTNRGWAVGVHSFEVFASEAWMQPPLHSFDIMMSCQDQIQELPHGAELLAGNDFCPFGMIRVGRHFLGIQGHPELPGAYLAALMQTRRDQIGDDVVDRALNTLSTPVHDHELTRWMVQFVQAAIEDRHPGRPHARFAARGGPQ